MSQHTPGPWARRGSAVVSYSHDGSFVVVAECGGRADNATMIAAAPDLLAACKQVAHEASYADESEFPEIMRSTFQMVLAAIAKAETT